MANTKSALKRAKQAENRRLYNRNYRNRARTLVKTARQTIIQGDVETAIAATQKAIRDLDVAASRGIIHPNNAARRKSRLMKQLNQLRGA